MEEITDKDSDLVHQWGSNAEDVAYRLGAPVNSICKLSYTCGYELPAMQQSSGKFPGVRKALQALMCLFPEAIL